MLPFTISADTSIFAYYSSVVVDNKVGISGFWHLALTEYCVWLSVGFSLLPSMAFSDVSVPIPVFNSCPRLYWLLCRRLFDLEFTVMVSVMLLMVSSSTIWPLTWRLNDL